MISAIVLINAKVDRIPEVAQAIAELDGVSEVYSVAGDADLIAMIRVKEHEQLNDVIADRLNKVQGVIGTNTHIAFRTYSTHDLEAAFSLGLDGEWSCPVGGAGGARAELEPQAVARHEVAGFVAAS